MKEKLTIDLETRSRSVSQITNPTLPPLDFSGLDSTSTPIEQSNYQHARHHANSVPTINYQHHDSVSSIHSDEPRSSFQYFDSSMPANYFELADSSNPSHAANSRRATDPSHNLSYAEQEHYSTELHQTSPTYYSPEVISPSYSGQNMTIPASYPMQGRNEDSLSTSNLAESLRLSSAQERRRRARARFEMGWGTHHWYVTAIVWQCMERNGYCHLQTLYFSLTLAWKKTLICPSNWRQTYMILALRVRNTWNCFCHSYTALWPRMISVSLVRLVGTTWTLAWIHAFRAYVSKRKTVQRHNDHELQWSSALRDQSYRAPSGSKYLKTARVFRPTEASV